MTIRETIDKEVREALEVNSRPLFPQIYEGYIEADALAQGEDAILRIFAKVIYEYFQNRNLQTMGEAVIKSFEQKLEMNTSGTIDERRAAIIEAINKRFILNEKELAAKIEQHANGKPIRFSIITPLLILRIWNDQTEENGEFKAYDILQNLKPIIPQNLQQIAENKTLREINSNQSIGITTSIATAVNIKHQ